MNNIFYPNSSKKINSNLMEELSRQGFDPRNMDDLDLEDFIDEYDDYPPSKDYKGEYGDDDYDY
jgi:hypothetical protein